MAGDLPLTAPRNAVQAILRDTTIFACPILGRRKFARFCSDRGLSVNEERLLTLERIGAFSPILRVSHADTSGLCLKLPGSDVRQWFKNGWAWDPCAVGKSYEAPDLKDESQQAYYSIFQTNPLRIVLSAMTLHVELDSYLAAPFRNSQRLINSARQRLAPAKKRAETFRQDKFRRNLVLLCQFVSNRYYPQTQGDQRTMRIPSISYQDSWLSVNGHDWDWDEYARQWDPSVTEKLFDLTPTRLRHAYSTLASEQAYCDPIEKWYQLTQFISVRERKRLKGFALLAETYREGAHMLRLLHEDLYDEKLPHPNEVTTRVITHIPELSVRQDTRRYLEFVANRYGVNPQPKLSLIVEGPTEVKAVELLFQALYGAHHGKLGIEIISLGGVDYATGGKADRFRAILRLIDYLHYHQTLAFLVLDNENYASRLENAAKAAKSIHHTGRYVTRPEYIKIWARSFEFDNFSATDICAALNKVADGVVRFTRAEVLNCKASHNPGAELEKLYRGKAGRRLKKTLLVEHLVNRLLSKSPRTIRNKPIVKTLGRVATLAARNPLPTMLDTWDRNQASKFLGKRRLI